MNNKPNETGHAIQEGLVNQKISGKRIMQIIPFHYPITNLGVEGGIFETQIQKFKFLGSFNSAEKGDMFQIQVQRSKFSVSSLNSGEERSIFKI